MYSIHLFSCRSSEYCTQCTQNSQKHNTFLPTYLFVIFFVCVCVSFFYIVSFFCLLCVIFIVYSHSPVLNMEEQSHHDHRCSSQCEMLSLFLYMAQWGCGSAEHQGIVMWPVSCGLAACKMCRHPVARRQQRSVQIICLLFSISQAVLTTIWMEDNLLLYC